MKRLKFPTLPCLMVTAAVIAALLVIGFTSPITAEAAWGGGSTIVEPVTGPGISAGVLDLEKQIVWPDPKLEPIGGHVSKAKIVLKDDRPFDFDRIPVPMQDKGVQAKIAGVKRGIKPDGPYMDESTAVVPIRWQFMGVFTPYGTLWPNGGGGQTELYKVAGLKLGGGVLSPKPPRSDDELVGSPPKPKAKIVMLGGGIGPDY